LLYQHKSGFFFELNLDFSGSLAQQARAVLSWALPPAVQLFFVFAHENHKSISLVTAKGLLSYLSWT
jgi:hypothetical protein